MVWHSGTPKLVDFANEHGVIVKSDELPNNERSNRPSHR